MGTRGAEAGKRKWSLRGALGSLRLAWKINGFFLLILAAALGVAGYISNLDLERVEIDAARERSIATSDRILTRIRSLMVGHQANTLESAVNRLASENPAYRNIRLISHGGTVVASQLDSARVTVGVESWPCTTCHRVPGPVPDTIIESCCEVLEFPEGDRALSVVTIIPDEEGCSSATCHTDSPGSVVRGILQADFSLARTDALIALRNQHTLWAILICLVLGTVPTWMMTNRLVTRRIRALREGAKRIADKDLSFRFRDSTGDGLSEVTGVFDSMTKELSNTVTELMSTKEYLQAIVENSADLIITVGPTGLIQTFNPGAEKVLGYEAEEVIGRPVEMIFAAPADRATAIEQLENGDHVVNYMTSFVTKDGDLRNVMITLSRLLKPDGEPMGTMGISKDVTEELQLQVKYMRSKRLAALGQALTGIQHSIKNMLNVMKGGSYMVKLGLAKDDKDLLVEGWEMVREGIDDMTQMSMGMLDFARTRKLKLEATDLGELIGKIYSVSQAKFREAGIELMMEVAPQAQQVVCDGEGIRSVVMDLISNAMDACSWKEYPEDQNPVVTMRVLPGALAGHIEIQVSDNGDGMTEEVRKRVFTPFFSTKEKKGTGLGLAVVSRIVESHEGDTFIDSEPGEGATFRVSLPIEGPSLREEEG